MCKIIGGKLLEIDDMAENAYIKTQIALMNTSSKLVYYVPINTCFKTWYVF